jgi:hypothetical protein
MGISVVQYENSVIGAASCWGKDFFVLGVVIGLSLLAAQSGVETKKAVSDGRLFVAFCEVSPGPSVN